jgi:cytochrome c oxidase cbb3-type subunit 2
MNRPLLLLLGIIGSVLASLAGLVFVPNWQARALAPVRLTDAQGATEEYPPVLDATEQEPGRRMYQNLGCIYCHSQQIRAASFGADIDRGWGQRRSVPRDYLRQSPPLMGTMRTGPDLANIGSRQPADSWHHLHLYDARLVTAGSIMPPFGFLYSVVDQDPGPRGYRLPKTQQWIVPSEAARQLVAYLKVLHQDHSLKEVQ